MREKNSSNLTSFKIDINNEFILFFFLVDYYRLCFKVFVFNLIIFVLF